MGWVCNKQTPAAHRVRYATSDVCSFNGNAEAVAAEVAAAAPAPPPAPEEEEAVALAPPALGVCACATMYMTMCCRDGGPNWCRGDTEGWLGRAVCTANASVRPSLQAASTNEPTTRAHTHLEAVVKHRLPYGVQLQGICTNCDSCFFLQLSCLHAVKGAGAGVRRESQLGPWGVFYLTNLSGTRILQCLAGFPMAACASRKESPPSQQRV